MGVAGQTTSRAPTRRRLSGPDRCRRKFLSYFPEGFRDAAYVGSERAYKWSAHQDWRKSLGLHPQFPLFSHQTGRWAKKVHQWLQRAKAGQKLFTAAEPKALIDTAKQPLKAMILPAINCGFGNTHCGTLPIVALELKNGWANFPRPKTLYRGGVLCGGRPLRHC